jgi:hypothetical protein
MLELDSIRHAMRFCWLSVEDTHWPDALLSEYRNGNGWDDQLSWDY